ncbi:MAG: hypothetical protein WC058_05570 [Phycisphaeraceae bacterium]
MLVFLSWSKPRSKAVAQALKNWIPMILNSAQTWMSEEDIPKGKRWGSDNALKLSKTEFGIVCVTKENLSEPWLLFESGAIAKTVSESFLCPFLLDVRDVDLAGPLTQFQATSATREDTLRLIKTINDALGDAGVPEAQLEKVFSSLWPDLDKNLQQISNSPSTVPDPSRTQGSMIEETVQMVRALSGAVERLESRVIASPKLDIENLVCEILKVRLKSSDFIADFLVEMQRKVFDMRKIVQACRTAKTEKERLDNLERLTYLTNALYSFLRRELSEPDIEVTPSKQPIRR